MINKPESKAQSKFTDACAREHDCNAPLEVEADRKAAAERAMDELVRLSQELGLYDD